jgi:hypothetical protein
VRLKVDVKRLAGRYSIALRAVPREARIFASFNGADPRSSACLDITEVDAPDGATLLRAVAECDGRFSAEETAPLDGGSRDGSPGAFTPPKAALKLDRPAKLVSRVTPKDTATAFLALDRLAKTPGATVRGASLEATGQRSEGDYLSLRVGADVPITGADLDALAKRLIERLGAPTPVLSLRLDSIDFPSGRDLTAFCDVLELDFDAISWRQEEP